VPFWFKHLHASKFCWTPSLNSHSDRVVVVVVDVEMISYAAGAGTGFPIVATTVCSSVVPASITRLMLLVVVVEDVEVVVVQRAAPMSISV
jgi:D-alanyl-D-alanine carboxypeptidase